MPQAAIKVDLLSKKYRLSHETRERYKTLRESFMDAVAAPVRWARGDRRTSCEEFWALRDVSFEIRPGEVVGVVGRNGAGKSTLLKILSRITRPSEGRVEINGRIGSLLEVGTGFHPELTGRENVYLNGSILGMKRREIDRKFDEIVAFAEVERFLDTPVKRYSSGMYVRLAFAVAAHLEPEILIVDEVLAVGDAAFQMKCLEKLRDCSRVGRTVLLVSHQMSSVRDLCTRALWLSAGSLQAVGPAAQIVERYMEDSACHASAGSWVDLGARTRTGKGQVRFKAVQVFGRTPDEAPISDGPLHCVLRMESSAAAAGGLGIDVQILDRYQNRLVRMNTFEGNRSARLPVGQSEVTLRIDRLHLGPGAYILNLMVGDTDDYCDVVSDAARIEVLPPDWMTDDWTRTSVVTRDFEWSTRPVASLAKVS